MLGDESSTEVVLAVLPGGSTNVVARNLGYANDLVEATAQLIGFVDRGEPQWLDIGRVHARTETATLNRTFTFAAGVVFDAEIVRRADASTKRFRTNDVPFVYHGFRSFLALRKQTTPKLVIDTPDGPRDAFWACIA